MKKAGCAALSRPTGLAKMVHFVILDEVKDLKPLKIRDSSLRSE
jgi:hypothetical protein